MTKTIVVHFKPTSRVGFINNVTITVDMIEMFKKLNLIKIGRMHMGDNKLYIYMDE